MIKYGDIIQLGPHRLMCGDAKKREDVEKLIDNEKVNLVLTDPPYGMKCQDKDGRVGGGSDLVLPEKRLTPDTIIPATKYPKLIGDNNQDAARKNYEIIENLAPLKIIWGGQYFAHFLPVSGAWIFWDKKTGNTDFSDGELAWVSKGKRVRKYEHLWNGVCRAGKRSLNLLHRAHPTQKPVELHMRILEDFSRPGDVVLDCFGGSGTTLIACNEVGRRCLMMELSPEYCEIIKERYEKLSQLPIMWSR